ncbi:MAG: CoF synthetase [Desulfuromonas sp.]|nr:MAG: CoF synthetase [Desulfuromonas sp.]
MGDVVPDICFADPEVIAGRQCQLLQQHLSYLDKASPWYREVFASNRIEPAKIQTLEDLQQLPLTGKQDLANQNEQFLAVGSDQVVDICQTSGTTGEPVTIWQTEKDLQRLALNEALSFAAAGITRHDKVLIGAALDRGFMAGLAYFLGLRRIGATALRVGSGQPALVAEAIEKQRPNVLVGVPSLFLGLARKMQGRGLDPAACGINKLICIGEPIRNPDLSLSPLGEALTGAWDAAVFGTYASTEMATAFTDCPAGCGGHLLPELIAVEIIDEEGSLLPPGEPGEVVVTPFGIEGTPLLRYRTGDIAALHPGPCACGRQTPRLGPIIGRKSQMLKVRGTTLYPAAIGNVLHRIPGVVNHYLEVEQQFDLSDRVRVVIGVSDTALTADYLAGEIAGKTRVRPEVVLISPEQITQKTVRPDRRKPITFFDYRKSEQESEKR